MTQSIKNRLINGVIWSVADKLISQFGFLVATLYLAKLIGPESFGLVGMLTIFMLLTESVVNNGFSQALVQRSHALSEEDSSTIFYTNLILGGVIYVILYALAPHIAQFYNEPLLLDISRLLFLIIIINSLTVVVRAKLLIIVDFKSQAIAGAVATMLSSSVGIYLATAGYDYWAFVWLLLLRALFQNLGLWCFSRWLPQLIFNINSLRTLFKFGSNLMLAGFVATLVNNLYVALIGRYFNATNVGYFTQATNLTNFISQFISSTLQGVTYPILTSIKEDSDRLISLYRKLVKVTMFFSLPALFGFAAISDSFVSLFLGENWIAATPIIKILCFARAITPVSSINMSILSAVGRSDLYLKVDLVKLPITLGTLMVSINYGLEAVALALLFNVAVSFFINAYFPGKLFGFGSFEQIKAALNYLIAAFLMYFVVRSVSLDSLWLDFLVSIVIGVVVYISIVWLLKDDIQRMIFSELSKKISKCEQ
ncbi:lipopolysaccharide biosynthesis protein [Marinobacter sp.]|uniref:lipopolysaccharide biosynthesis protein n=1 Tax=Marinobacter sp. TaxID=50741 RepID=UPI003A8F5793